VTLEAVQVGDRLLARPGERIPVGGEVAAGPAPRVTVGTRGEGLRVREGPAGVAVAGTPALLWPPGGRACGRGGGGTLRRRARRESRRMVEEAQAQKAPIERVLDRSAKWYTPIALTLGALLWWWSGDVLRAITMLIVFCPCVMVLATPTALVASIGNAALRGSLVKRGATIEALAKIH